MFVVVRKDVVMMLEEWKVDDSRLLCFKGGGYSGLEISNLSVFDGREPGGRKSLNSLVAAGARLDVSPLLSGSETTMSSIMPARQQAK